MPVTASAMIDLLCPGLQSEITPTCYVGNPSDHLAKERQDDEFYGLFPYRLANII